MKKVFKIGGTGGTDGTRPFYPIYIGFFRLHQGMHFENKKCNQSLIDVSAL
jgi:hypothetical protein